MNSYMRQTPVPADQMHSFLKDKQAWENAIAMYQGPDPLDHWYNYVCWYENHGHGDPENKFRETLERCLTLYEHSDYYKQDPRMVRLWLKYIDMQTNPLEFYKVLYQRGVGRQVASFFISWATYYESIHAIKEAESVYSIAFQEKAQPYDELNHAYSKFLYVIAAPQPASQRTPQAQSTPPLQAQSASTHQQVHYQQHPQHMAAHLHGQGHSRLSQIEQQATVQPHQYRHQHIAFHQQQLPHQMPQQTLHHIPPQQHQQQHHHYQQHINYHQPIQQQQQQHQSTQITHHYVNNHEHTTQIQTQPQTQIAPNQEQIQTHSVESQINNEVSTVVYGQVQGVSYVPQLPTTETGSSEMPAEHKESNYGQVAVVETPIEGIRLPRKFVARSRNNFETWTPALFLEEPPDPNRRCHYDKDLVYPANSTTEYSPEEIRARKYSAQLEQFRAIEVEKSQGAEAATEQLKQSHEYVMQQRQNHIKASNEHLEFHQQVFDGNVNLNGSEHNEHNSILETGEEEEDAGEELEENNDAEDDNEEDDYAEEEEDEEVPANNSNYYTVTQQSNASNAIGNTVGDLEEQIEASTIRFSQNKTIKIKFKKERPQDGVAFNGSNYGAYTIESIYQQEIASPSLEHEQGARRNGHSFHPYNMGHTSTPKTSSKRHKTKLKRVDKYQLQAAVACSSSNSSSTTENGVVGATADRVQTYETNLTTVHNATFNDNANYSFSSAVALENSNCSLSSAVDRLNFRDATVTNMNANVSTTVPDISTYQENSYFATQHDAEAKERRLQKSLGTIKCHLAKEAIDPFNSELCKAFLTKLNFPGADDEAHANYKIVQTPLPKIANTRTLNLPDGVCFSVDKEVGRGSYGSVYKAIDANTGAVVALKFQKPPNTWEIYICDQVLKRIQSSHVLPGLMDISTAIIAPNASLIATEFSQYGSLLDINNKIRQATSKVMHESLVMHFSAQICNIIHHLHQQKIIHADIKPDNFLLMRIPNTDLHFPSLRLIDFGCAIDMTLFPDQTKFRKVIQTDGFTCIEMQEGRPWSYETDLFCIAGTVHVMLMGEYMQLQKRSSTWDIKQKLPRYLKKHVWTHFFHDMLNIRASKLPDLKSMRDIFSEEATKMDSELQSQIRTLSNILHRR